MATAFYNFANLAEKYLFPPFWGGLGGAGGWPSKCSRIPSKHQKAHPWPETLSFNV